MKLKLLFLTLLISNLIYSQSKLIKSESQIITIAGGVQSNVTSNKLVYLKIEIFNSNDRSALNYLGDIWISDVPELSDIKKTYYEIYQIYKVEKKENGIYNYWTQDKTNDQSVLFQLNQNGIKNKLTCSKYVGTSGVSKQIDYLFD